MTGDEHVRALEDALDALRDRMHDVEAWGARLAARLRDGGRLLAAGNGGSAAHAQHLTAELVGRYRDERRPLSAIALHADTSSLTAIVNDYGPDAGFARQVHAHGRPGDVLVVLSTSGRSPNLVAAVDAARRCGMATLALTGPAPNPLAEAAEDALAVEAPSTATVQEVHQVVVHLVCAAVDAAFTAPSPRPAAVR
jgi:D-sedoheptulose 7-phosphate isomerase